jgi:glutamate--cysteine ligase
MSTPVEAYEEIGTKVDGEYRQLSVNQLQIENEYYSSVRPKRVANSGERPTAALRRGGIEYVEIRSLDINTFDPVGISQNTMRFVEAFLIYCLLEESPDFDDSSYAEAQSNHSATATSGREPDLKLMRDGSPIGLQEWATQILGAVAEVAELIDASTGTDDYSCSVRAQAELVKDPERTPSARVLQDLRASENGFFAYAFAAAHGHKSYFAELEPLSPERQAILEGEAEDSLTRQSDIEASDKISLDQYLAQYFAAGC